jgi:acetyltransferase-like isoleucine patch superfamily enzyme
VILGRAVRIIGLPIVEMAAGSSIEVGDRCVIISRSQSTALGVSRPVILRTLREGARIDIGADVGLSGTTICAATHVSVGDRVLLGADVVVSDTDFHEIDAIPRRYLPPPQPNEADRVVIGRDVFIGARSIILSGSSIGEGSVIGAGSVVKGEIPAGVVAAGNPCRVIRPLLVPDS